MCGIALSISSPVSLITGKQHHRGPNGDGRFDDGSGVQIGHNRLSIIDLSDKGRQPMDNSRYVLSCNGEIYNYGELKSYLDVNDDLAGYNNDNDSLTLLKYIDKFGLAKAINDINGMYAFILYDKIEKKIHLVVDRMGQKPMYYYNQGETFAVASSPAALLHLREKWSVNEEALASYWKLGSVMKDSIFDSIRKVNAGELVTCDLTTKKITTQRYWTPSYVETNDIEGLILDSINKVKVADVPVFIFLSGGVDSSLVASQCKGMHAIHLQSPELKYAREVAEKFDIQLHTVTPATVGPIEAMRDYSIKCGEPSMAALIPWITAQEASKFCKVAISANGADELFFGYDRTTDWVSEMQLNHLFRAGVDYPIYRDDIDERLSTGRWLELMTYVQHDLNKTLDFASMAHSLEVRSPFLDHRLVEAALSIPAARHGRKGILKGMLHQLGFGKEFTDRPKMGFSLYTPVPDLDRLQIEAYQWCINEGWLELTGSPGKRDAGYLRASAFGFKQWWETWEGKMR